VASTQGQIIDRGKDKNGRQRWLVKVYVRRVNGRRKYVSKTVYGGRKKAEDELHKLVTRKKGRQLRERTSLTVKEAVEQWLTTVAVINRQPQTVQSYRFELEAYVVPELAEQGDDRSSLRDVPLWKVAPADVQALVADLHRRGMSPRTIRYSVGLARQVFQWAVKQGWIGSNPATDLDLPENDSRPRYRMPTDDEVRSLFEQARKDALWPLWVLMFHTGIRPSEALALRWEDLALDADEPTVTVRGALTRIKGEGLVIDRRGKSKNAHRTLGLEPAVVEALRKLRVEQAEARMGAGPNWHDLGLVFTNEVGQPRDWGAIRRRHWDTIKKAAGVPDMVPYAIRHYHVSIALKDGEDPVTVAAQAGHHSAAFTLKQYAHELPGARRQVARTVGKRLGKLIGH